MLVCFVALGNSRLNFVHIRGRIIDRKRGDCMKIIHCADLHLDSKMTANLDKDKAKERKTELLRTFERMVDYAATNQVDAILLVGDLFDTKNVSALAKHTVINAIRKHPNITFYYLRGNHDRNNVLSMMETPPDNLKLFGEEWTSYGTGEQGNIVISGIELTEENAGSAYSSLVLDAGKFHIVLLHGQESETGTKDRAEVIHLRALKNKGIDYLALGHVHAYKEARLDGRGIYCYPGCLEGRGFDECGEHGFVLLTIEEDKKSCHREFIPFAFRNLYTVLVDVTGCQTTLEMANQIQCVLKEDHYEQKDLLKIVLTGALDVECEKDMDYLRKRFEADYYLVKLEDETKLKVDFETFLLDRSLKGEFVRTVMAEKELNQEEQAAMIRYGLQAMAGEELDE